ncbi:MAG TPA: prepilin-type N-terminal cleavage/methylation domain-containing protein [Candidatus Acidoferrum sp.]|jgi:prepilin-type N-terminal cleavage/methylation domain-containing protein
MRNKQKGFSLIELLIVVAIILIIAAIAIPNLLRARISANESSAVGSLRTINTAEIQYATTYPTVGFSASLSTLGGGGAVCTAATAPLSTAACLVDDTLGQDPVIKSGYTTKYALAGGAYSLTSLATTQGTTGIRSFYTDQSGVIRVDPAAGVSATSNALQ